MPWCPHCDRYLTPPSVRADGTCPTCGRAVDRAVGDAGVAVREHEPRDDHPPVPWHFKFLVGSLVIYLGYRAWQGIAWLQHHVH